MGPHPAVAAIRLAVRRVLHDVDSRRPPRAVPRRRAPHARPRSCSSPAPAAPTPWRSPPPSPSRPRKLGVRAGGVTVDHGLQARLRPSAPPRSPPGCGPCASTRSRPSPCTVGRDGGPEAAARDARYAALDAAAERHGAAAVLLGHTRDDQAETVLLGLARGSGIRSLSGMAAVSGAGRPLPPALPPARPPDRPQGLPGPVPARLGRPAQRRPRLHPLPAAPRGPARPGEGARQGRRRGAGPYRPALPRRRRRPGRLGRRGRGRRTRRRRAAWTCAKLLRAAARRAPPGAAPRRHRGGRSGRFAVRPAHRGSGPADHRLARPGGHQPPRPSRRPAPGWQTGDSAGLTHAADMQPSSRAGPGTAADRAGEK